MDCRRFFGCRGNGGVWLAILRALASLDRESVVAGWFWTVLHPIKIKISANGSNSRVLIARTLFQQTLNGGQNFLDFGL